MSDLFTMSLESMLQGLSEYTSSLGSEAGTMPFSSPGGLSIDPFGPAPALASHSASQEEAQELTTQDTSGLSITGLSRSADLQSRLESRLRQRMDVNGSPEYVLTWKHWDMESGPPICALRASQRRISDNGCGGWPTPRTVTGGAESTERKQELGRTTSGGGDLQSVAIMAGWGTPSSRDWKDSGPAYEANPEMVEVGSRLPRQAMLTRGAITGYPAPTEKRGVLNPALPRWLMGFPIAWDLFGAMVTLSSRKSRRNSSKHT